MYAAPMIATVAALTSTAPAGSTSDAPPCFEALTLADALARAKQKQQFLIVKATAAWCTPCKAMDKTTFRDARVEAWIKENGLAIQLDVDANTADAKALRIMAMPTMIAYKGDQEFDRIVGFKDADQLMKWLDGVTVGKVHDADLVQKAKDAQDGRALLSARERLDLADGLLAFCRYEPAATEYVWLWEHIPAEAPELIGLRESGMADRMKQLASVHPRSKALFAALRDALAPKIKESPSRQDLRRDWIVLNNIIGEQSATIQWIEAAAKDESKAESIRSHRMIIQQLLSRESQWRLLGTIVHFPLNQIDDALKLNNEIVQFIEAEESISEDVRREMRESAAVSLRETCGQLYAAMLAADRAADAAAVFERAQKIDRSPAMAQALDGYKAKVSK